MLFWKCQIMKIVCGLHSSCHSVMLHINKKSWMNILVIPNFTSLLTKLSDNRNLPGKHTNIFPWCKLYLTWTHSQYFIYLQYMHCSVYTYFFTCIWSFHLSSDPGFLLFSKGFHHAFLHCAPVAFWVKLDLGVEIHSWWKLAIQHNIICTWREHC